MNAPIKVLQVHHTKGQTVKAILAIRIGGVTIRGCRILQQPGRPPWLAMPQIATRPNARDGQGSGWTEVVTLSAELSERVSAVALKTWGERHANEAVAES